MHDAYRSERAPDSLSIFALSGRDARLFPVAPPVLLHLTPNKYICFTHTVSLFPALSLC